MIACMECGASIEGKRSGARYCSRAHKQAYLNRQISRGNGLLPLVYRWRALRSAKPDASNEAFSRLTALLASWIDSDREAGRAVPSMPPLPVALVSRDSAVFRPTNDTAKIGKANRKLNAEFRIAKRNQGVK